MEVINSRGIEYVGQTHNCLLRGQFLLPLQSQRRKVMVDANMFTRSHGNLSREVLMVYDSHTLLGKDTL